MKPIKIIIVNPDSKPNNVRKNIASSSRCTKAFKKQYTKEEKLWKGENEINGKRENKTKTMCVGTNKSQCLEIY